MNHREIRCYRRESCPLCGSQKSHYIYKGLKDRIFGVSGKWNIRRCQSCGLYWLDPAPLKEELHKLYINYYTHQPPRGESNPNTLSRRIYNLIKKSYLSYKYGYYQCNYNLKKILGLFMYFHPGRRADLDFSVMYLPMRPKGQLLDVGCGSGWLLKRMRKLGWNVEGVDFDPKAVENAQKENLKVRLGSLEDLHYPDNYFDAITMSHLIEHVPNPLQLLSECYRILKPGGYLVVVTPNGESLGHKIFKNNWRGLEPPRHLHIFTTASLAVVVRKANFKKLKVQTTIRDANGLFIASRSIQKNGKLVWGESQSRTVRIWARIMQLVEWLILKVKPSIGEEILLIAEK